jgi:predicted ferric reductase
MDVSGFIKKVTVDFFPERVLGWGLIVVVCMIPVIAWWRLQNFAIPQSVDTTLEHVGLITAIIATVLYALSLVLMTRIRFLEWVFGGLNRVYIAHHITGGVSLVMALFHPVALAIMTARTSMEAAALFLIPNSLTPVEALFNSSHELHASVLDQWAIFAGILGLWLMIGLLLVTIFIKLPYRIWLISHKLLGIVFIVIGLHIFFIDSDTTYDAFLRWYLMGWLIIGIIAYIYKTALGKITIRKYLFEIDDIVHLGGGVTRIKLASQERPLPYQPGQFVFIRFINCKEIGQEWHPFSISSEPSTDIHLELSVKALGDYTNNLTSIKRGTVAEIEGAYGKFSYLNYRNRDQVWIAGGIGIAPFISMIKSLPTEGYRVYLFYCVNTRSEIIDWQLLYDQMNLKSNSLRVIPYIADEQGKFIDLQYIQESSGSLDGRDYYLCGPPAMMQALKKQLLQRGVMKTSIHSEEFSMQ